MRKNPALLAAFALLAVATAAQAQGASKIDVAEEGSVFRIRVEATLPAAPNRVWALLTDCGRAKLFVPYLESCRMMDRDPAGRWDVRENVVNPPLLPRVRTVIRSEYQPTQGFTYRLVSGDLRKSEGSWTLKPVGGGTSVVYSALVAPDAPAPGFMVASSIRGSMADMVKKLDALVRAAPN